ncbi:hypothetical protein [Emticicia fontis]
MTMFKKTIPAVSRVNLVNRLKIFLFLSLLTFGFTSCQDSEVTPKPNVSSEKPPHEPDYGG